MVASRREAIAFIEQRARELGEASGFRRCPMYLYAGSPDAAEQVQAEAQAVREAGVAAQLTHAVPEGPPPAQGPVLRMEQQAQFHPMRYLRALAARAAERGARLFERSPVLSLDVPQRCAQTASGKVTAREIVLATHSPIGFHLMQAGMVPRREYGLAAPLGDRAFPAGIFWAQGQERLSVRSLDTPAGRFLVCVGQDHKTGQHDAPAAMQALEAAARRRLGVQEIAYRWSAQNFQSPDGLPYIGTDPSGAHVATGFATDGLVYGTLAAQLLAELLLGREENRWHGLYKATRFTPVKSAKVFGEETAAVVKAVVQDYLTDRQREQLNRLAPGNAAIADLDGERVAAYRAHDGKLFAVSPVCTHLKCIVHWNPVETSWDCPCHGSRFAPDGRVLEGPAIEPLRAKLVSE